MSVSVETRVLIVEDNRRLARALSSVFLADGCEVAIAHNVACVRRQVATSQPTLVLLDVALPDGDAFDVLDVLDALALAPTVVAMSGSAEPTDTFHLGQRGVRYFLQKPLALDRVNDVCGAALAEPTPLIPHVRLQVGLRAVHEVEEEVRRTMVSEALARAQGSRRGAARLLRVSRQLLQHMLRRMS